MCARSGFIGTDLDEIVADIFASLFMGEYLKKYRASRAKFATYIYGHIRVRILSAKRALVKRHMREIIAEPDEDSKPDTSITSDLEEATTIPAINQMLTEVYLQLSELPSTQTKNLARLFRELVEQVVLDGRISHTDIAKAHGYSRQAIGQQFADLMDTIPMRRLRLQLLAAK